MILKVFFCYPLIFVCNDQPLMSVLFIIDWTFFAFCGRAIGY